MELYELIYVSLAERKMSQADLTDLLDRARAKNARLNITGQLVYHRQEFKQILEEDEVDVLALYDTICEDTRHRGPYVLWEGPIAQRSYPEWSMAFLAPGPASREGHTDYANYLRTGLGTQAQSAPSTLGKRMFLRCVRDDLMRA